MQTMKRIKKWLLGVLISTIPVVIAACYGVPYDVQGRVVDAKTAEGLNGIEVTCINYDDFSTPENEAEELVTYTTGGYYEFEVTSTGTCAVIKLRDVDGAENGTYLRKTVFVPESSRVPNPIEMRKLK